MYYNTYMYTDISDNSLIFCIYIPRITIEQFIKILSKLDCEFWIILVGISIILDIPN